MDRGPLPGTFRCFGRRTVPEGLRVVRPDARQDHVGRGDHVASDDKKLADFIRAETANRKDDIAAEAKRHFEDYHFWVDDEDGEVEISVTDIEADGGPEIIEAKPSECVVQMTLRVDFEAQLSYSDTTTGIWDSEDGRMMFMEQREEDVSLNEYLVVDVHATFEGTDPESFE